MVGEPGAVASRAEWEVGRIRMRGGSVQVLIAHCRAILSWAVMNPAWEVWDVSGQNAFYRSVKVDLNLAREFRLAKLS